MDTMQVLLWVFFAVLVLLYVARRRSRVRRDM